MQRKTRRLEIRALTLKDYSVWRDAYLNMPKSQNRWDLGGRAPKDLTLKNFKKIIQNQIARRKNDTYYDFGIFMKNGTLLGMVSIMEVSRNISQTAYLGYRIFSPYWGQGYAKEAVRAMIDIGFKDLKLHRIEAGIEPRNFRSISLAKSLGMRKEGLKKRALYLRNQWIDLLMYTLTCEDLGIRFRGKLSHSKPRS